MFGGQQAAAEWQERGLLNARVTDSLEGWVVAGALCFQGKGAFHRDAGSKQQCACRYVPDAAFICNLEAF